jgi:hypothetical protein
MELRALRSLDQLAAYSCLPLAGPFADSADPYFRIEPLQIGGIDQDLLEYLYSGAALS